MGSVVRAAVAEMKQEKKAPVRWDTCLEAYTVRLHSKRGTASKSSLPEDASQRLDAKSVFPFFHSSWAGVPKTFAFFSCFISTAIVFARSS